jgi:hypothetical protein
LGSGGLAGRGAPGEPADELGGTLRLVAHDPGAAAVDQLQPGVGQDAGQPPGMRKREELVVGRPGQQGRLGEGGQLGGSASRRHWAATAPA